MAGVPARHNLFNGTICRPFRRKFMKGEGPPEVLVSTDRCHPSASLPFCAVHDMASAC